MNIQDFASKKDGQYNKLISWFISNDKKAHIEKLMKNECYIFIEEKHRIDYFVKSYEIEGYIDICLDYLIKVVGETPTSYFGYRDGKIRMEMYIYPFLEKMMWKHFQNIFSAINNNKQLYEYTKCGSYIESISKFAKKHMPNDFDTSKYPKIERELNRCLFEQEESNEEETNEKVIENNEGDITE